MLYGNINHKNGIHLVVIEEREFKRFPPFVTWALIAVNVVVFFAEVMNPWILDAFSFVPAYLLEGDGFSKAFGVMTIFTAMFLHADIIHLLSNMYVLWVFGDDCENVYGRGHFTLFYFTCGVGASLLYAITTPSPEIPVVGASGALFGVLAAYAIFFPTRRLYVYVRYLFIPVPAIVYVLFYAIFEFFYTLSGINPYIAHTAHIGGFLTGVLLSIVFKATKRPRIYRTARW